MPELSLDHILSVAQNARAAFSFWSAFAGLGGLGLIAAVLIAGAWLPGFIRTPLILIGLAIAVGAGLYQAGTAKGAADAFQLQAERAIAAERKRAAAAEYVTGKIAAQAARDLEVLAGSNKRLKDLNDALSKDKDRARACVDRDTARRLREL